MEKTYRPEKYWTEVANRIQKRDDGSNNVVAGDDEPYYRYKRKRFLDLLHGVDFLNKSVLEIGCGPGGNLLEIHNRKPAKLVGVDISEAMILLAKSKLPPKISVIKINGTDLPFDNDSFDIVFTATVLQHNTDEEMLKKIIKEIIRVSRNKIYLFERIENKVKGDNLCLGRPVAYYSSIMEKHGFQLKSRKNINTRVSYYVSGAIRKIFNPKNRQEGEPLNNISIGLQKITLPFTKLLDILFKSGKDVARLEYEKQ